MSFWGTRGAFWGGLWGLFFGGLFITVPVTGPVIVLGYLAAAIMSAIEGAAVAGGVGVLGAALYSVGVPKDSVIEYEAALKADNFLVLVYGGPDAVGRAKEILTAMKPFQVGFHQSNKNLEAVSGVQI